MYHVLAYHKQSAGGVVLEDLPGVQDNWASLNASGHYLLPQDMLVRGVYNLSPNIFDAQISQPALRSVALPTPVPFDTGATPTSLPSVAWYYPPYFRLKATDELAVLQSDNAGGAIQKYAFLFLTDSDNRNVPQGNVITLHGSAAITASLFQWTAGSIVLNQTIPYGTYAVTGMDAVANSMLAARMVFPSGGVRPGCLGRANLTVKPSPVFMGGEFGVWGTFVSTALPSVEVFMSVAGAAVVDVYFQVVKIA